MARLKDYKAAFHNNKAIIAVLALSLIVKLALFGYAAVYSPSTKFMPDTPTYVEPGVNLIEKGVFATFDEKGRITYEINRTPGYPLFLGFLSKVLRLSFDAIIAVQILLVTFAGYIVYKAAYQLDKKAALLAAVIFLFDQPVTISALMLLTGALYTVFIAAFMYFFLKYLNERGLRQLVLSALALAMATFIKPTSYYLAVCLAGGALYALFRIDRKKAIAHALALLLVFYSCLGLWHYRNYIRTGNADFTVIDNRDLQHMGITHNYARYRVSENIKMNPLSYYANITARSLVQFFTIPGTLKYLGSKPIKIASKIYGYPWVGFWLVGLLFARYDKLSYRFLGLTVLYFAAVSILVTGLCVGSRFRAPVMPLISILSASGWARLVDITRRRFPG